MRPIFLRYNPKEKDVSSSKDICDGVGTSGRRKRLLKEKSLMEKYHYYTEGPSSWGYPDVNLYNISMISLSEEHASNEESLELADTKGRGVALEGNITRSEEIVEIAKLKSHQSPDKRVVNHTIENIGELLEEGTRGVVQSHQSLRVEANRSSVEKKVTFGVEGERESSRKARGEGVAYRIGGITVSKGEGTTSKRRDSGREKARHRRDQTGLRTLIRARVAIRDDSRARVSSII
ncbi:hypothetical protein R1sor_001558 [Riccia sorocarpa]|uniref:Uncharacterized protein n=1 Tax=Riccia sorocarpa TaxID=122646 RepID=A0ABD3GY81_9MARC